MVRGATVDAIPTINPERAAAVMPSGPEQDRFGLLVEADDDDDEVALLCHRGGVGSNANSGALGLTAGARIDIVCDDVKPGFAQMPSHRMPHLAKPDDPDATHDALAHISPFPCDRPPIVDVNSSLVTATERAYPLSPDTRTRLAAVRTWRVAAARPALGEHVAGSRARCLSCPATTPVERDNFPSLPP